MRPPWSEFEDLQLRIFSRNGWKTEDIAEHMKRDYNDVSVRKEKINCYPKRKSRSTGRRLTNSEIEEILARYYDQEQSMRTIVREMNISYTTVRRHVNNVWRLRHKKK